MKTTRILSLVLVIIMMFSLTACGNKLEGKYMLYSMEAEGETIGLETLKLFGLSDSYIEFEDDEFKLSLAGESSEKGEVDTKNNELIGPDGDKVSYTLEDDKFIIEVDGEKMTFVKEDSDLLK